MELQSDASVTSAKAGPVAPSGGEVHSSTTSWDPRMPDHVGYGDLGRLSQD